MTKYEFRSQYENGMIICNTCYGSFSISLFIIIRFTVQLPTLGILNHMHRIQISVEILLLIKTYLPFTKPLADIGELIYRQLNDLLVYNPNKNIILCLQSYEYIRVLHSPPPLGGIAPLEKFMPPLGIKILGKVCL